MLNGITGFNKIYRVQIRMTLEERLLRSTGKVAKFR